MLLSKLMLTISHLSLLETLIMFYMLLRGPMHLLMVPSLRFIFPYPLSLSLFHPPFPLLKPSRLRCLSLVLELISQASGGTLESTTRLESAEQQPFKSHV